MSKVIDANRKVHQALIISGEYQKSPHRSLVSQQRLREKISRLVIQEKLGFKHLDVGCGDGFMFDCVPRHWARFGIDVTDAMLAECGKRHPDVNLRLGVAENLPFESESFDFVTCYSFLDHLEDTETFYSEAMRVLKRGGNFYFGLSPNRDFLAQLSVVRNFKVSAVLKTLDLDVELKKAFDDGTYYQEQFGIDASELQDCEPGKSVRMGLHPWEELGKLHTFGAMQTKVIYEWIFQQNRIDPDSVKVIEAFLPFTAPCFKYFDLFGCKS